MSGFIKLLNNGCDFSSGFLLSWNLLLPRDRMTRCLNALTTPQACPEQPFDGGSPLDFQNEEVLSNNDNEDQKLYLCNCG
jgi:hypothetical protein